MRFQLHRHAAAEALRVVLTAPFGQVAGNPPDAFGHALHDTGAAQGFQSAHMGGDHLARVTARRSLPLRDSQVMVGAVHAIDGERSDVPIGRAHIG